MPTDSVDAPNRIATLGQVRSLFSEACVDGVDVVVASCEFELNSWPNRLPNPDDELLLDDEPDEPNMLPPPQPDNATLAVTASTATAARFKRLSPAIIASSWPKGSEKDRRRPYSRAKAANQRRCVGKTAAG